MNEALNVIHSRRSIRRFKPQQISASELQEILDAALCAPSAMNRQQWHFTVIQNGGLLARMVETIRENLLKSGNEFAVKMASAPNYDTFYGAPTVILISGDDRAQNVDFDCATAAENIALAAESLGIGSCVITSSGFLFGSEKGHAFSEELGIPDGYRHSCTVALGYKDGDSPAMPARNPNVLNFVR
jgi:nitroreductase